MQNFRIRLNIAGKSYSLDINREKEEVVRLAERRVNEWFTTLQSQYEAQDEDYLALAALNIALQAIEVENSRSMGQDLDELNKLDRQLDDYLNKLK